jgi:alkanesulfonate monooxygenase SsuD/methylene tetrahydromethanopterin reductase-like flavin-dependent oxidoreductase (luciferase family)
MTDGRHPASPAAGPPDGLKLSILAWPQNTDWASFEHAARRVDELGYDALWTWDHLYPIVGSWQGPIFEGWMTLATWAEVTKRVPLGLMVGANTFRNPALVAKMATTLDHASGGRAVLGIGGAWFETEHTAFGLPYGHSPGERLRWLDEAVRIMRGMLDGTQPSGERYYAAQRVRNDPPPLQRRLPLLIGGGGERRTLRTVAKYADIWNVGGDLEKVSRKDGVLRRHCSDVGRDHTEIERTLGQPVWIVRDSLEEARSVAAEHAKHHPGWRGPSPATPETLARRFDCFWDLGFRHIYFDYAAPWDEETLVRLIRDVKPLILERAGVAARVGTA